MEYLRPGTNLIRASIARAIAGPAGAVQYASQRWGARSDTVDVVRSAVAGSETSDFGGQYADASSEFILEAMTQSALGRMSARRVPPNVTVCVSSAAAAGYWRGQSKPIKVSRLAFDRNALPALSLGAMVIVSKELASSETVEAENTIRMDLLRAAATLVDGTAFSAAAAGAGVSPAGLLNGISGIASAGNPAADVAALIEAFDGDLATAAFVGHPSTLAAIALTAPTGVGSDLGARGGSIVGIPAFASSGVTVDSDGGDLILIDQSALVLVDDGGTITASDQGTVEMDDAPAGATDTPVSASASMVSVFQSDSIVFKVARSVNWRAGIAPVFVTGASYGA